MFEARAPARQTGKGTLLFVDEIHRFNRAQQDAFLPVMEDGTITLVGATTENPSFELNAALLSRARVLVFRSARRGGHRKLLARAEEVEGKPAAARRGRRAPAGGMADGDGRAALTLAEEVWRAAKPGETFDAERLQDIVQRRAPIYDKCAGRPLQPDLGAAQDRARLGSRRGALLSRPHARRRRGPALSSAAGSCAWRWRTSASPIRRRSSSRNAAKDAYDYLGSPEGELALAQATVYLATAPKSNAVYTAFKAATRRRRRTARCCRRRPS